MPPQTVVRRNPTPEPVAVAPPVIVGKGARSPLILTFHPRKVTEPAGRWEVASTGDALPAAPPAL